MNEFTQKTIETEEGDSVYFKYSCCFNEGVSCYPYNRQCETCGWNPDVARARLEKYCREHGIRIENIHKNAPQNIASL